MGEHSDDADSAKPFSADIEARGSRGTRDDESLGSAQGSVSASLGQMYLTVGFLDFATTLKSLSNLYD
jgi:hypothetical protein